MYKFKDNQLSLTDFGAAVGLKLNPENRWIRKARSVPWEEIELRYAQLFTNRKGNVAKPLRLALGACIIQAEYGFSDEETANMIQEHPYLQYFCGYREYDDSKLPFDPSLMVYFRKRLTPEILGEINEMIIAKAEPQEQQKDDHDDDHHDGHGKDDHGNSGTMIMRTVQYQIPAGHCAAQRGPGKRRRSSTNFTRGEKRSRAPTGSRHTGTT